MFKKLIGSILPIIFLFIFCSEAKAQVLINEFSSGSTSDWIELTNIATVSADLSGYKLTDSGANDKVLTGVIPPGGFISFDFSNWLNNSADSVRLFNGETLVDSINYGGANQVCAADASQSIGRYPDAGNTIDRFSASTRDASNNSAALAPCPSPTPEPTKTPTPATMAPATSPTSSPSPVPTKKPTPWPSKSPSPEVLGDTTDHGPQDISGLRNSLAPDPTTPPTASVNNTFPVIAGIFVSAGLALVGLSGYMVYKKQKGTSSATISE